MEYSVWIEEVLTEYKTQALTGNSWKRPGGLNPAQIPLPLPGWKKSDNFFS